MFDGLLRHSVQQITNSNLSEIQWIQTSLPVRDGGLGIRSVTSLALHAFVASAASTLTLQSDILADCAFSNNFLQTYLATWSSQFGDVPEILPTKQPFWNRPGVLVDKALVEASLNSPHSWASFLAASSQHSGDWLFALPIALCGLKLDDQAVRVAVGLRLGLDVCVLHCGSVVDTRGVHSCLQETPSRTARHHARNDLIAREPTGMFRTDGKRLDGLTLIPWQSGKALCWDVTVIVR